MRRGQRLTHTPGTNAKDEDEADVQQQKAGLFRAGTASVLVELFNKGAPVLFRR